MSDNGCLQYLAGKTEGGYFAASGAHVPLHCLRARQSQASSLDLRTLSSPSFISRTLCSSSQVSTTAISLSDSTSTIKSACPRCFACRQQGPVSIPSCDRFNNTSDQNEPNEHNKVTIQRRHTRDPLPAYPPRSTCGRLQTRRRSQPRNPTIYPTQQPPPSIGRCDHPCRSRKRHPE